jgi:hypothetical protein
MNGFVRLGTKQLLQPLLPVFEDPHYSAMDERPVDERPAVDPDLDRLQTAVGDFRRRVAADADATKEAGPAAIQMSRHDARKVERELA